MDILAIGAIIGVSTYIVEPDDLIFGIIFELVVLAAFVGFLVIL
jgi:hypothetical protein